MAPVALLVSVVLSQLCTIGQAGQTGRSIGIQNDSLGRVEIHWIHPETNEKVLQSNPFIYPGATFSLNSYVTHAFEAREIPGKSGKCAGKDETCRVGYFEVNNNDDQGMLI